MNNQTISQGLRHLKKLKGQLAELQTRAIASVSYKEGESPAFSFNETMDKMDLIRMELVDLESSIAVANATTTISFEGSDMILKKAVRMLQEMRGQIAWLRTLPSRAQPSMVQKDFEYNEDMKRIPTSTTWKCDLPEAARAAKVDALQNRFDTLNGIVESANHITVIT